MRLKEIVTILGITGGIYVFNPHNNLFQAATPMSSETTQTVFQLTINARALADSSQGNIKAEWGSKTILVVTTDEDGRLDLQDNDRDTFNPIFAKGANSITVPTDQRGSYKIEFHPAVADGENIPTITLGTITVQ